MVVCLASIHPELSSIEQVWCCTKCLVRSSLHHFTWADLQARVEEARLCATEEVWVASVNHSSYEDGYWSIDNIH